jgi:hypothetical protein
MEIFHMVVAVIERRPARCATHAPRSSSNWRRRAKGNEGDTCETGPEGALFGFIFCLHAGSDRSHEHAGKSLERVACLRRQSLGHGDASLISGFLTFFCWLAWRECSLGIKVLWFVLIMVGGNIIMSLYVPLQLFGLPPDEHASALFRQTAA